MQRRSPGEVRDAIIKVMADGKEHSVRQVREGVSAELGEVPASSVRSYLRLNGDQFKRTSRGRYRMTRRV